MFSFFFNDAALYVLGRIGPRMALDHARVLDRQGALAWIDREHAPGLAAIPPGNHTHLIAPS